MNSVAQQTTHFNVTTPERTLRAIGGVAALIAVVTGAAGTPVMIFILSVVGAYLIQTGTTGIARYLHAADRVQVWQHTLSTAALLPVVVAGDLVSSFIVFSLSAMGGFIVTTAIVGRDAIQTIAAWLHPARHKEHPLAAA